MEKKYLTIEDAPDYVKDSENNAILNTNLDLVLAHKAKKKQKAIVMNLETEINKIKEEIQKIKNHLNLS